MLADLEQQEVPNTQKRKQLYHALSVWSGVVRSCTRQTYTIITGYKISSTTCVSSSPFDGSLFEQRVCAGAYFTYTFRVCSNVLETFRPSDLRYDLRSGPLLLFYYFRTNILTTLLCLPTRTLLILYVCLFLKVEASPAYTYYLSYLLNLTHLAYSCASCREDVPTARHSPDTSLMRSGTCTRTTRTPHMWASTRRKPPSSYAPILPVPLLLDHPHPYVRFSTTA